MKHHDRWNLNNPCDGEEVDISEGISAHSHIYGTFVDANVSMSVFANGGSDEQWRISIPNAHSKPIPYSNPNPYPKPNPSTKQNCKYKQLKTRPFHSTRKTHDM